MSPAVLTETVWALAHEAEPVIPARVVVITTTAGRQAIERELVASTAPATDGHPAAPLRWNGLRAVLLGPSTPATPASDPAASPRYPRPRIPRCGRTDGLMTSRRLPKNEAAADFILDEVRRITFNDDTPR